MDSVTLHSKQSVIRVIGYIDLTIVAIQVLLLIGLGILYIATSWGSIADDLKELLPYIILFVCVSITVYSLRIYSAICLIVSGRPNTPLNIAKRKATIWKIVTAVFFVIRLFGVIRGAYFSILIGSVIDAIFLFIVQRYTTELDQLMEATAPSKYSEV